jgi:hypothetical protein
MFEGIQRSPRISDIAGLHIDPTTTSSMQIILAYRATLLISFLPTTSLDIQTQTEQLIPLAG